jgi:hypothetical protein
LFNIEKKCVQETSRNFQKLQTKHQIPFPKLQRILLGILNSSNSRLAIVAMPPIKILRKYVAQTTDSPNYFDLLKGRAGSHFAPAKLISTSARISKIENPDSLWPGGGHFTLHY